MSLKATALKKCLQAEHLLAQARKTPKNRLLIPRAIELYQDVLDMDIELADPYLGLALLCFSAGNLSQAFASLNTAEKIDPTDPRIWQLRHRLEKTSHPLKASFDTPLKPAQARVSSIRKKPGFEIKTERLEKPVNTQALSGSQPSKQEVKPPVKSLPSILGPDAKTHINSGPEVEALQVSLRVLGYQKVQLSSQYDQATLNAVQAIQMKFKLKITGFVSPPFLKKLQSMATKINEKPKESLIEELGPATQKNKMSKGPQVEKLQKSLLSLGYTNISSQGIYDTKTVMAVRQFQQANQLKNTGNADKDTLLSISKQMSLKSLEKENTQEILTKLNACALLEPLNEKAQIQLERFCSRLWEKLSTQKGLDSVWKPDEKSELQLIHSSLGSAGEPGVEVTQGDSVILLQRLLDKKTKSLKVTGKFDLDTFMALKDFQEIHHLEPTGVTDVNTRKILNQELEILFTYQTLLEDIQQAFIDDCKANQRPIPKNIIVWSKQIMALAQGEDFETVLKSALPEKISSELGPNTRQGQVSEGPEVELLQLRLKELGEPLEVTGHYDTSTTAAVRRLQTRFKLPMTGIVNKASIKALFTD